MFSWIYPTLFAPSESPAVYCFWVWFSLFTFFLGQTHPYKIILTNRPPVPAQARDRRVADISQVRRGTLFWPIAMYMHTNRNIASLWKLLVLETFREMFGVFSSEQRHESEAFLSSRASLPNPLDQQYVAGRGWLSCRFHLVASCEHSVFLEKSQKIYQGFSFLLAGISSAWPQIFTKFWWSQMFTKTTHGYANSVACLVVW